MPGVVGFWFQIVQLVSAFGTPGAWSLGLPGLLREDRRGLWKRRALGGMQGFEGFEVSALQGRLGCEAEGLLGSMAEGLVFTEDLATAMTPSRHGIVARSAGQ